MRQAIVGSVGSVGSVGLASGIAPDQHLMRDPLYNAGRQHHRRPWQVGLKRRTQRPKHKPQYNRLDRANPGDQDARAHTEDRAAQANQRQKPSNIRIGIGLLSGLERNGELCKLRLHPTQTPATKGGGKVSQR